MTVTYSERARQSGPEWALLQQATKLLEEIVGPSSAAVTAEWDQGIDERGRTIYTLTISDFAGQARATFTRAELESRSHLRSHLYSLWGDLLQVRSDAQVRRLQELVKEGE